MTNIIFEATLASLEAQKKEAMVELSMHFSRNNDYDRDAIINSVKKLNEAETCLETLSKFFIESESEENTHIENE